MDDGHKLGVFFNRKPRLKAGLYLFYHVKSTTYLFKHFS